MNIDLSVVRADLPAFTSDWSKCFVQIHVDGSENSVRTQSTTKAGKHQWGDRFSLPARPESVLRFELKRSMLFRRQRAVAFAETSIQDLVLSREKSGGQANDLVIPLRPYPEAQNGVSEGWQLIVRLHGTGSMLVAMEKPHVPTLEGSLAEIVLKLEAFMVAGDAVAQLNPYANVAWKTVIGFYTIIKGQLDRYGRLEDLCQLMKDSYSFVENIKAFPERIPNLEGTIHKLLSQTVECTMFIRECSGHGFGERVLSSAWTDRRINQFTQSFSALKQSLETGTSIQVALVCFRIDENVNKLLTSHNLMKLGHADMDDPSRAECLPNTRMDILIDIFEWASMPTPKGNVFWLHGFPGSGKSTIATSVANVFRDLRRLGAFTFFSRSVASRNDPALLIRTLAYQLGEFDPRIGNAISQAIEDVPSIRQAPLRWQFQKLLVEPFSTLKDTLREGPIFIIIDALDECTRSPSRDELLRVLASETPRLPPTVRIFITSRAERDIHRVFIPQPHIRISEIDIKSSTNEKDVRTYIHHRMTDIRMQNEYLGLPPDWPGDAHIDALALRASGLFIWAQTACLYIQMGQDPEERLAQLVHAAVYADAETSLDKMYVIALESAGKWDDTTFATDFREIIGMIIVAENPLTARTLDLLNADADRDAETTKTKKRPCLHTIRHLGTVLQWAEDKPICVMHPSFTDFVTETRRCGSEQWFIDRPVHHLRLARLCVARMDKTLRRNMFGLTLSTEAWKEEVVEDVAYPVRYWVDHLCEWQGEGIDESVGEEIERFLKRHFLHWIEVMTLMRKARQTIGSMVRLKEWVDTYYPHYEPLCSFIKDAVRFCQAYTHVYEQHPLLVYQSALPFTPTSTTIFQTFSASQDPAIPFIAGGFRDRWSPLLMEFGRPGGSVIALAYSSDGRYIASTNTKSIFVWDSTSGELVSKPMSTMGKHDVTTLAFSPNNQHIASGTTDGGIHLWDGLSGERVFGPLQRHDGPVWGLAFSNDGTLLVSASKDQTILVWDARRGTMVHPPLTGHQKTILALAFSPTEMRFASGSRDRSIRVWNATSGDVVFPPIQHFGGGVTSLAYTPDGNKIVSGSDDRTIRVWDAHEGTLLLGHRHDSDPNPNPTSPTPIFKGHNSDIHAIAVSPCGTLLASASRDTTVRLWSLTTGLELTPLVRQHRLPVRCVVFSPDGKRLVTGSQDTTLRVWDVESVGSMGGTRLHKGLVSHLAFSEDGTRIVSGGLDKTVRMWCAMTGRALIAPLKVEKEVCVVALDDVGGRILAVDKEEAVFAWDVATREHVSATPADHPAMYAREERIVLEGRWVVDKRTDEVLSMLPNMSPAKGRASWGNRIAIGLANGSIVIMHFPGLAVSERGYMRRGVVVGGIISV